MTTSATSLRNATYLLFALNGAFLLSWLSRIPEITSPLDLSPGELGTTLLALSIGSVTTLPTAGWLSERFGLRAVLRTSIVLCVLGTLAIGLAVDVAGSRPLLGASLLVIGLGMGVWDVGMNLQATEVERRLGRAIMPRFHAAFSAATVLSALVAAGLSWLGVPLLAHLAGASVLVLAVGLPASRHSRTEAADPERDSATAPRRGSAWREPRTLLIGVVVLAAALAEGTANDWLALAFREGYDVPTWLGILALAVFLATMTAGRVTGTILLDRYGRVPVLRGCFGLAALGSLLVVFGSLPVAFLGAALWGLGASLGFPVGMSAATDDPRRAAGRISVVSTIGYCAFLAGPPLLGLLGDHVGVLRALLVVSVASAVSLALVSSMRERRTPAPAPRPRRAQRT